MEDIKLKKHNLNELKFKNTKMYLKYLKYKLFINFNHLTYLIFVWAISISAFLYLYENIDYMNNIEIIFLLVPLQVTTMILSEFENDERIKNISIIPGLTLIFFTYSFFYIHYQKYISYNILKESYINKIKKWIEDDEFLVRKLSNKDTSLKLFVTEDYSNNLKNIKVNANTLNRIMLKMCSDIFEILKDTEYDCWMKEYTSRTFYYETMIIIYHENDLKYK